MNGSNLGEWIRNVTKKAAARSLAMVLVGVTGLAPVTAAAVRTAKSGEENRIVSYRAVDRGGVENLQRWVAAGHEDWCKDARLVATEELKRIAADFAGDATELTAADLGDGADGGAKKVRFEWTPLDGRATYRVTLEQFEWLLPIAKDADVLVWVPTVTEIQIHE